MPNPPSNKKPTLRDEILEIRNRIADGKLDLREVGALLTGKWDQDLPNRILTAASNVAKTPNEIVLDAINNMGKEIGNILTIHLNANTQAINHLDTLINNKGKNLELIGVQVHRDSWPEEYWSSVMFTDKNNNIQNWGPEWKFRNIYAEIEE